MYQKYDTYLDTGTLISIHSNLVTIYLQIHKLFPRWYQHVCNIPLAMVKISVQYCPSNYNSTWPYLRGGSPKLHLRPTITAQPGRYLSENADFLPVHRSLSVLVFNIGWLKDKMPVLSTDWNHGALFHKQRRELNSVVVARGLSNLPKPRGREEWVVEWKQNHKI